MSAAGILGGAFDPPHVGHVALAREAVRRFALDRLLVRVVEDPGHKEVETAPQIRLVLAELAFAPLDEAEVGLDRHPRTVDSLRALGLDEPLFLIGADEFAAFSSWTDPAGVLALARVAVATRPGATRAELDSALARAPDPARVVFFPIEPLAVSSSGIRARIRAGESIDGLVPAAVAAELERLGLYRGS